MIDFLRTLPRSHRKDVLSALLAAVLSQLGILLITSPLRGDVNTLWGGADSYQYGFFLSTWQGFWSSANPRFGFPLGADPTAYPSLEVLPNFFGWILLNLTGSVYIALNVLFLVSFFFTGLYTFVAFRLMTRNRPLAVALAVSFALSPYGIYRWFTAGHWSLAMMSAIPAGIVLSLLIGLGKFNELVGRRDGAYAGVRRSLGIGAVLTLVVVSALSNLYYAFFAILSMVFALAWRVLHGDRRRALILPAAAVAAAVGLTALTMVQGMISFSHHPDYRANVERTASHSMHLSGNLGTVLLPEILVNANAQDPNGPLAYHVQAEYAESNASPQYGTLIGSSCAVFLSLGLVVLFRGRNRRRRGEAVADTGPLMFVLYLAVALYLFMPRGSLNYLFAVTVSPQIRSWSRLAVYMLLLVMLAAAALSEHWPKLAARDVRRWIVGSLAAAIVLEQCVFGLWGVYLATGNMTDNPVKLTNLARTYAEQTNTALPGDCGILVVPTWPFTSTVRTSGPRLNNAALIHALTNTEKKWSSPAIENTDGMDLLKELTTSPWEHLDEIRKYGFCGIHVEVDTMSKSSAERMISELEARLGPPVVVGGVAGEWEMFKL